MKAAFKRRSIVPTMQLQVVEDEDYRLHLQRADQTDKTTGLYQVVLTCDRMRQGNKLTPATHVYYVLAEDESGAINQVDCAPFNESGCAFDGKNAIAEGRMTATAHRLPFYMRGWGLSTF